MFKKIVSLCLLVVFLAGCGASENHSLPVHNAAKYQTNLHQLQYPEAGQ